MARGGMNIFGETSEQVIRRLQAEKTELLAALENVVPALNYAGNRLSDDMFGEKFRATSDSVSALIRKLKP